MSNSVVRVGINGFGRTGRAAARVALERDDVQLVAINSRADTDSHAYLLKYDSVHGTLPHETSAKKDSIIVDNREIQCFQYNTPAEIPWDSARVDIVIESTGVFKKRNQAAQHLRGLVKKVIVSAPSSDADKTLLIGVNEDEYDPNRHNVVSSASCTTNCLAILCKIIDEAFGIKRGFGTTVHGPTLSQNLLDSSHKKDKRRGRSTFLNIVPTTTGAAKTVGVVLPKLKDKLHSYALRVPVGDGSIIVLNIETKKPTDAVHVNSIFENKAKRLNGILDLVKDEIVSQDIVGNQASAIIDPFITHVVDNYLVTVFAWYDNEMGYSTRLIDLAVYIGKRLDAA